MFRTDQFGERKCAFVFHPLLPREYLELVHQKGSKWHSFLGFFQLMSYITVEEGRMELVILCDISLLFPSVAFMFVTIYWNADISFLVHTYPVLFSPAVAAIFSMPFQQNRRQKLQKCSSDTV